MPCQATGRRRDEALILIQMSTSILMLMLMLVLMVILVHDVVEGLEPFSE